MKRKREKESEKEGESGEEKGGEKLKACRVRKSDNQEAERQRRRRKKKRLRERGRKRGREIKGGPNISYIKATVLEYRHVFLTAIKSCTGHGIGLITCQETASVQSIWGNS